MRHQRWLRIIPVALIMYTISYVDRTNVSLAMEPALSSMTKDLDMDPARVGNAVGIFFLGYVLLQIPGGYWARYWSARKSISVFLVSWGLCAVGCSLARNYSEFVVMRFLLGVAESGVYPATVVLLANWFPRAERARANAYWNLCQPLAVICSSPVTAALLEWRGWRMTLALEGLLPFCWLPLWWYFIRDHPREAAWISKEEREWVEGTLQKEEMELATPSSPANPSTKQELAGVDAGAPGLASLFLGRLRHPGLYLMIIIYFLHNCAAYGCMTFLSRTLNNQGFSKRQYGWLFAIPYVVAAIIMVLNSRHSDKTLERRGHVAAVYLLSGTSLILSVALSGHFWISFGLMCLAIPGPFAALAPFWAIPGETMPRPVMGLVIGLVNAFGNVGGYVGPKLAGLLTKKLGSLEVPFAVLGAGMLIAGGLSFLLPRRQPVLAYSQE